MIELKECIRYWRTYWDQHENQLSDHQYQIIAATVYHLVDYGKMKEQVNAKLPLGPSNPNR